MQRQCLVALYSSRNNAEQAHQALLASGITDDHIRITDAAEYGSQPATDGSVQADSSSGGLWDWLFGSSVPEDHQRAYRTGFSDGQTAVSVLVEDAPSMAGRSAAEDVLERCGALDLHVEDEAAAGAAGSLSSARGSDDGQERTIPLPEEQLKVGKRATDSIRHVRTYVVEEPVEQDVTLHNERAVIERRPATDGGATGEPAERDYEVRERHEEPVVEKRAGAGEELVIRKEAEERTEHVRDTVRKTKADIEGKRD